MSFEECFEKLFELTDQVSRYNGAGDLCVKSSNVDPIGTLIRKYKYAYGKTKSSSVHLNKFRELYDKFRGKYLNSTDFDEFMAWFERQTFTITATTTVYFPLSLIFRKCCVIARNSEQESQKSNSTSRLIGSTYPEQFMFHLFRILSFAVSEEDKKRINQTILELQEILGLEDGQTPDPVDDLGGLVGMATELMQEMGVNVPKKNLDSLNIGQALRSLSKDPNAKNNLKGMFKGIKIKDSKDIPGAFSQILSKMKDNAESIPEPVQRSMAATVENPTGQRA